MPNFPLPLPQLVKKGNYIKKCGTETRPKFSWAKTAFTQAPYLIRYNNALAFICVNDASDVRV